MVVSRLADAPYFSHQNGEIADQYLGAMREAIRKRIIIQVSYEDAQGQLTLRRVYPFIIWDIPDGWMFSGWCELRDDFRTFRFDRIKFITMTDEIFDYNKDRCLSAFFAQEDCSTHLS